MTDCWGLNLLYNFTQGLKKVLHDFEAFPKFFNESKVLVKMQ